VRSSKEVKGYFVAVLIAFGLGYFLPDNHKPTVPAPLSDSFLSAPLLAQSNNEPNNSIGLVRRAFAYEQITLDGTAGGIGFTAATYAPTVTDQPSAYSRAEMALVNCNGAQARYRIDGGTVTSSNGMLINDGDWLVIYGYNNIAAFKGIRTGGTSTACDVTFSRNR